jgi:hypothetical protein
MVFQIEIGKRYGLYMFKSKPNYFGVVVALENGMIISPFIIFRLVNSNRLTILVQVMIRVVSQFQSMIIITSLLLNAEKPWL